MVVLSCDCCGKEIDRFVGIASLKRWRKQGPVLDGSGVLVGGLIGRHLVCGVCYEACEAVMEGMKENKIVHL